jgi:hypothetical protein
VAPGSLTARPMRLVPRSMPMMRTPER